MKIRSTVLETNSAILINILHEWNDPKTAYSFSEGMLFLIRYIRFILLPIYDYSDEMEDETNWSRGAWGGEEKCYRGMGGGESLRARDQFRDLGIDDEHFEMRMKGIGWDVFDR
jgi:hypothetical protein